jgi:hypothetical protein
MDGPVQREFFCGVLSYPQLTVHTARYIIYM